MSLAVVITTIQSLTSGVRAIADGVAAVGGELILVGDRKTPEDFAAAGSIALSLDDQRALPFATARVVPENSYTRKMVGYLVAMERGHEWIRETDDDNSPYGAFFDDVPTSITARVAPDSEWVNPYAFFTDRFIWPRGFPLDAIQQSMSMESDAVVTVNQPCVLQALADGDPDVDAIYRLSTHDARPVTFSSAQSLLIPSGSWAPFNSQATTWPKEFFSLLYLPATCSFRMTDIWRSFITQRIMREHGGQLIFTAPTVFQDRNAHDLMRDFRDEIEGYVSYRDFVRTLDAIDGIDSMSLSDGLRTVYRHLVSAGFFLEEELVILEAWLADLAKRDQGVS